MDASKVLEEMSKIRNNVKMIQQFAEIPEFAVLKIHMKDMIAEIDPLIEQTNEYKEKKKIDSQIKNYIELVNDVVINSEYYKQMKLIFPLFSNEFESLFIMVLKDSSLAPFEFMLNTMENVAKGSIEKDKGEMAIAQHLGEQFIKPVKVPSSEPSSKPKPKSGLMGSKESHSIKPSIKANAKKEPNDPKTPSKPIKEKKKAKN